MLATSSQFGGSAAKKPFDSSIPGIPMLLHPAFKA